MQVKAVNYFESIYNLGETNLICWSTGATDPILAKTKKYYYKISLTNFLNFFLIPGSCSIIVCF